MCSVSLWNTSLDKIEGFVKKANNFHSTIKFTAEMSETEITFPGGRGKTWVFLGCVCAARDSKLAPRSKKKIPLKLIPCSRNGPIFYTPF